MQQICECKCGLPAPIAKRNHTKKGHVKGQPVRFVQGHGRTTHGFARGARRPEYPAFLNAKFRCTNPKLKCYPNYGGRGIKFCFESFEQFFAHIGPRPTPEHSLDRIENDGNYEIGNVQRSTASEQIKNQRKRRTPCSSQ